MTTATAPDLLSLCQMYISKLMQTLREISDTIQTDQSGSTTLANLERHFRNIEDLYSVLENIALRLPERLELYENFKKLSVGCDQKSYNYGMHKDVDDNYIFEEYMNSMQWFEFYYLISHYGEQYLRKSTSPMTRRRPTIIDVPPKIFSTNTPQGNPHIAFLTAVDRLKQEALRKKLGIGVKVLESSTFGCVLELEVITIVDNAIIVIQKTLIVENNGIVEMVIFAAPHEDWRYLENWNGYSMRRLDLTQKSRYKVYQKLNEAVNNRLSEVFTQAPDGLAVSSSHQTAHNIFTVLSRYHKLFQAKCRNCGKVLKDYLPCVYYDPRMPLLSTHEGCQ